MTTLTLPQPKSLLRLSDLTLLLVALVWGTSYGVAKGALVFYPVLGFLAVRFLLTFVLLLPTLVQASAVQRRDTSARAVEWPIRYWPGRPHSAAARPGSKRRSGASRPRFAQSPSA